MTSILLVEDDVTFCSVLQQSLEKREHEVRAVHTLEAAKTEADNFMPEWVLLDLNMGGQSGLTLIPELLKQDGETRIVVLTGYASIATAVEAIKLGAVHYLTKPVGTDEILAAFHKHEGDPTTPINMETLTLPAAEKEHISSVFTRNGRNISATARELGMHRRTLQRKLEKLRIS